MGWDIGCFSFAILEGEHLQILVPIGPLNVPEVRTALEAVGGLDDLDRSIRCEFSLIKWAVNWHAYRVLKGRTDEIAVCDLEKAVDLWEDHR